MNSFLKSNKSQINIHNSSNQINIYRLKEAQSRPTTSGLNVSNSVYQPLNQTYMKFNVGWNGHSAYNVIKRSLMRSWR